MKVIQEVHLFALTLWAAVTPNIRCKLAVIDVKDLQLFVSESLLKITMKLQVYSSCTGSFMTLFRPTMLRM